MSVTQLPGILLALTAAAVWGAGDFSGGFASRRLHHYQALFIVSLVGLPFMLLLAWIGGESLPGVFGMVIAALAGACGAIGLAALYRGLTLGNTALVAPVAGVIGALIPALVGMLLQGFPGALQLSGFGLAGLGIWSVSANGAPVEAGSHSVVGAKGANIAGFGYALLAGLGFGGFLTLIARVPDEAIFAPLVVSKLGALLTASILLWRARLPVPRLDASPVALLAGVLDTGGNLFYLLATRYARLDTAAVLSSLYPAGTVLLAAVLLRERISARQWLGVAACIGAIALITI